MIDELEDQLVAALRERTDALGPVPVRPTDLRRRVVRRRRRRIAVPVAAVIGLIAGLLASRELPQRALGSDPTVTVGATTTPATTIAMTTSVVSPTSALLSPTSTAATAADEPLPSFGLRAPTWLVRTTVEVSTPAALGARRLVEFGIDDDWRSSPTLDVLDRVPSSADPQVAAPDVMVAGRPATISTSDGLTIVRIELTTNRTVELWGWGLDQQTTVAAASSVRLVNDEVVLDPPSGLHARSDVRVPPTTRTRMTTYEPAAGSTLGDGFVKIMVSNDPVIGLFSRSASAASSEIDGFPALVTTNSALMRLPLGNLVTVQFDGAAARDGSVLGLVHRQLDGTDPSWVMATEAPTVAVDYPPWGADGRIETFTRALPAGFAIVDRMAPIERGVVLGAFADDNWITLSFAHATIAGAPGSTPDPVVTASTATQRTLHWRSPSGWVYDLTADGTKAGGPPPLTEAEMIDLLRALDTA